MTLDLAIESATNLVYAGVGSRQTPEDVLAVMKSFAQVMALRGWTLRSGAAKGADSAFESGSQLKEIFLPFKGFNGSDAPHHELQPRCFEIASRVHPAWSSCTDFAKRAHARNVYQVFGVTLDCPVAMVVCWTPDGSLDAMHHTGGTRTATVLAQQAKIPVFNLANTDHMEQVRNFLLRNVSTQDPSKELAQRVAVHAPASRIYLRSESVVFFKTKDLFGGFSNMASGFPMYFDGTSVLTSEALYQACRFPHLPNVQKAILEQRSPMTAKMLAKCHSHETRPDWDDVRFNIMRWALRMKLAHNFEAFSELLLSTGELPIVEQSFKDATWGAKPADDGLTLQGCNVLGRLLMELRNRVQVCDRAQLEEVGEPRVENFLFLGRSMDFSPVQASATPV